MEEQVLSQAAQGFDSCPGDALYLLAVTALPPCFSLFPHLFSPLPFLLIDDGSASQIRILI